MLSPLSGLFHDSCMVAYRHQILTIMRLSRVTVGILVLLGFGTAQAALADSASITQIVFTTSPQTIAANTSSSVMTVQTQNASSTSEKISGGPQVIAFISSSGTGTFSNANSGACTGSFSAAPFTLTMSTGTANKNFCYRDSTVGTHTISVSAQGQSWTAAVQSVVITAPPDPPPAPDTTPEQFTVTDRAGVSVDSEIVSDSVTVSGIDAPAEISTSGGEYSVNGGAYTSSAGTVVNGDVVTLRHSSSSEYGGVAATTLRIGGVSDTFTSTTSAPPSGGGGSRRARERRAQEETSVEIAPSEEATLAASIPSRNVSEMPATERRVRALQMQVLDLARAWVLEMEGELASRR